jgi:hypothetical protein
MVFAATIQDELDPVLWGRTTRQPSDAQLAFLEQLAGEAGASPPEGTSLAVASAWIDAFLARKTIAALRTLRLQRGDVVDHCRPHENRIHVRRFEVSSLGDSGLVYFRGGNGQCGWPSALRLVARAGTKAAATALAHERFWIEELT